MNKFDAMRVAVAEARDTLKAADQAAAQIAPMLVGRLRHVDRWTLADLKRELRSFNMKTQGWAK